jgi:hypothetical protein
MCPIFALAARCNSSPKYHELIAEESVLGLNQSGFVSNMNEMFRRGRRKGVLRAI